MSITAAEARQCAGLARQIRGLLAGIDNLGDAFDDAERLEGRIAAAKKEKLAVEADIAASRAAFNKLDGDFQKLQASYSQLDAKHREEKARLDSTLSATRAELAAAQQLKHDTEEQLATITAKWHLKTGQATAQ
jgi:chromosome segregation ATPase